MREKQDTHTIENCSRSLFPCLTTLIYFILLQLTTPSSTNRREERRKKREENKRKQQTNTIKQNKSATDTHSHSLSSSSFLLPLCSFPPDNAAVLVSSFCFS